MPRVMDILVLRSISLPGGTKIDNFRTTEPESKSEWALRHRASCIGDGMLLTQQSMESGSTDSTRHTGNNKHKEAEKDGNRTHSHSNRTDTEGNGEPRME